MRAAEVNLFILDAVAGFAVGCLGGSGDDLIAV